MKTKNTTMKNLFLATVLVAATLTTSAQIGIGTTNPNSSAALDVSGATGVSGTSRGMIIPRVNSVMRTQWIQTPERGMIVYDTNQNSMWLHDGTNWGKMVHMDPTDNFKVKSSNGLATFGFNGSKTTITSSASALPSYTSNKALGTLAAPTATVGGSLIYQQLMNGYNGTDYSRVMEVVVAQQGPTNTNNSLSGVYQLRGHDSTGQYDIFVSLATGSRNGFINADMIMGAASRTSDLDATSALTVAGYVKVIGVDATADGQTDEIKAGMIRYNTTSNKFEGFTLDMDGNGTANDAGWVALN
ncbi:MULTISPECIES: hypothetical protein [unclassified Polaribacter]|uniref:hypothetical protein n=1 Tax=unclassified Polaribacter TaxID=196858 RepID=UPI0011BD8A7E|nr:MULTISPECIES: hypothetical protein [unclassified Polaribacter]TXD51142.1 hypothetical protein ES043_13180 [Polaribacter sp. IC063]TXD56765.1 hypothetical protein ES044_16345 [Polaribacter sp. IC066]